MSVNYATPLETRLMDDDIKDIFATDNLEELKTSVSEKTVAKPVEPGRQREVGSRSETETIVSQKTIATLGTPPKAKSSGQPTRKIMGMNAKERTMASGLLFILTLLIVFVVLISVGAIGL